MKRISPSICARIVSGKRAGLACFFTSITLVGTIIGIIAATGATFSVKFISVWGMLCVLLSVIVAYLKGRMKLLPDLFIDEMGSGGQYVCEFCSSQKLHEACELTKPYYKHEYVDFNTVENWRLKNDKAFVGVINSEGELCACFGILALTESFMDQFIKGRLTDTQLLSDDIYTYDESVNHSRLYISGIVVKDPSTYKGAKRSRVMIWSMLVYLKQLYGLDQVRELYAIAVTREAEKLMKHLDFQLIQEGKYRVDKCNLYRYQLSKDSWDKLVTRVGDCSPMSNIQF